LTLQSKNSMPEFRRLTTHNFNLIIQPWINGRLKRELISLIVSLCQPFFDQQQLENLPLPLLQRLHAEGLPAWICAMELQRRGWDLFSARLHNAIDGMTVANLKPLLLDVVRAYYDAMIHEYVQERAFFREHRVRTPLWRRTMWMYGIAGAALAPTAVMAGSQSLEEDPAVDPDEVPLLSPTPEPFEDSDYAVLQDRALRVESSANLNTTARIADVSTSPANAPGSPGPRRVTLQDPALYTESAAPQGPDLMHSIRTPEVSHDPSEAQCIGPFTQPAQFAATGPSTHPGRPSHPVLSLRPDLSEQLGRHVVDQHKANADPRSVEPSRPTRKPVPANAAREQHPPGVPVSNAARLSSANPAPMHEHAVDAALCPPLPFTAALPWPNKIIHQAENTTGIALFDELFSADAEGAAATLEILWREWVNDEEE